MGFKLRIHADEIESIGGVDVAAGGIYQRRTLDGDYSWRHSKTSCNKSDWQSIASHKPSASLEDTTHAPARKMLDAGMAIT